MTSTPLTSAGPVITWLCHFLSSLGLNVHAVNGVATALLFSSAILLSWGVCALLTRVVSPVVTRVVTRTSVKWDDVLLSPSMLKAWSYLITSIVMRISAPMALELYPTFMDVVRVAADILIVCAGVNVVNCFIMATYTLIIETTSMRVGSLKGIRQMLQIVAFAIAAIIVVSLLIDRSPLIILSGLGASAAVLMLVFKDSIMGLVAGVQLTLNDMLRPGDWITVPGHGANGTVIEVTLTTVKVRNFDQTIITIPPYALVSESFQNWRGMKDSGGRRIMRSILIDLNSVRFMASDELRSISSQPWVAPELAERIHSVIEAADTASTDNSLQDIAAKTVDVAGGIPNVTIFRHYLEHYITSLVSTIRDVPSLNCMVRELQPTPQGLPIEIYFFTSRQEWVSYEHLQADVIDHILAIVGRFGLRTYQSPSGYDLRALRAS